MIITWWRISDEDENSDKEKRQKKRNLTEAYHKFKFVCLFVSVFKKKGFTFHTFVYVHMYYNYVIIKNYKT